MRLCARTLFSLALLILACDEGGAATAFHKSFVPRPFFGYEKHLREKRHPLASHQMLLANSSQLFWAIVESARKEGRMPERPEIRELLDRVVEGIRGRPIAPHRFLEGEDAERAFSSSATGPNRIAFADSTTGEVTWNLGAVSDWAGRSPERLRRIVSRQTLLDAVGVGAHEHVHLAGVADDSTDRPSQLGAWMASYLDGKLELFDLEKDGAFRGRLYLMRFAQGAKLYFTDAYQFIDFTQAVDRAVSRYDFEPSPSSGVRPQLEMPTLAHVDDSGMRLTLNLSQGDRKLGAEILVSQERDPEGNWRVRQAPGSSEVMDLRFDFAKPVISPTGVARVGQISSERVPPGGTVTWKASLAFPGGVKPDSSLGISALLGAPELGMLGPVGEDYVRVPAVSFAPVAGSAENEWEIGFQFTPSPSSCVPRWTLVGMEQGETRVPVDFERSFDVAIRDRPTGLTLNRLFLKDSRTGARLELTGKLSKFPRVRVDPGSVVSVHSLVEGFGPGETLEEVEVVFRSTPNSTYGPPTSHFENRRVRLEPGHFRRDHADAYQIAFETPVTFVDENREMISVHEIEGLVLKTSTQNRRFIPLGFHFFPASFDPRMVPAGGLTILRSNNRLEPEFAVPVVLGLE